MACGTPVVTSNITAMPEVAGGAALLVNPTSVEQNSAAMERIATDAALRRQLHKKGLSRVTQFAWVRTVAKVREVLMEG